LSAVEKIVQKISMFCASSNPQYNRTSTSTYHNDINDIKSWSTSNRNVSINFGCVRGIHINW